MTRSRNELLDFIRGITIILVVLGHCIQMGSGQDYLHDSLYYDNYVFRFIYSFHMPMFMLISGYLFYSSNLKRTFQETVVTLLKSTIIPIVLWAFCVFSIENIISFFALQSSNLSLFSLLTKILYSFWFLWAIVFCSIIVAFNNKVFKDNLIIYFIIMMLFFFIPDSFNLGLYKFVFPYFVIGYWFHKFYYKIQLKKIIKNKYIIVGLLFLYVLLLFYYEKDMYIYISGISLLNKANIINSVIITLYRFMIGLTGCILFIIFLHNIYIHFKRNAFCLFIFYLGRNTLGIYIISDILFNKIVPYITMNFDFNYLSIICESIIILVLSLICIYLIKKSKALNILLLGNR